MSVLPSANVTLLPDAVVGRKCVGTFKETLDITGSWPIAPRGEIHGKHVRILGVRPTNQLRPGDCFPM